MPLLLYIAISGGLEYNWIHLLLVCAPLFVEPRARPLGFKTTRGDVDLDRDTTLAREKAIKGCQCPRGRATHHRSSKGTRTTIIIDLISKVHRVAYTQLYMSFLKLYIMHLHMLASMVIIVSCVCVLCINAG